MRICATVLACALAFVGSPAVALGATPRDAARADSAREQARDVLRQKRFSPTSVPSPLRSLRERIGRALRSLGRPLRDAYDRVAGWLPGGPLLLAALLAVAVIGLGAALASRAGRRLAAAPAGAGPGGDEREAMSAARLRRRAEEAERGGRLDEALRLRFRAGLVDLHGRELIELRPALTNRELLREVRSPTLVTLVDGFEAVAYGGRPAVVEDVASAREGWPLVAEEASSA